ncbi:hypothetical protein U9R90_20475 [Streptomyces sp. E11-3]
MSDRPAPPARVGGARAVQAAGVDIDGGRITAQGHGYGVYALPE